MWYGKSGSGCHNSKWLVNRSISRDVLQELPIENWAEVQDDPDSSSELRDKQGLPRMVGPVRCGGHGMRRATSNIYVNQLNS